ncbi:hypothetical protein CYY_002117 [Polysphondylium violaceum]|uniref:C2H2-type domain-containing protein n=1 Tax=Polysphondylium violaceum TaxID=133409 RepID=A0A8J4PYY7_9MYCE|nr:hypothetical protein CYY_002117 [Polysphondylium violaceum]
MKPQTTNKSRPRMSKTDELAIESLLNLGMAFPQPDQLPHTHTHPHSHLHSHSNSEQEPVNHFCCPTQSDQQPFSLEMMVVNRLTKEEIGTSSNPFPKLEHKVISKDYTKNPDGTFTCCYDNCGKIIRGNKGNLSSHFRTHTKHKKTVPKTGYEQLYIHDGNPRGPDLRFYAKKYGVKSLRKDLNGDYLCFYKNCNLRMLTNYSRHLGAHEQNNDPIEEHLPLIIFKG